MVDVSLLMRRQPCSLPRMLTCLFLAGAFATVALVGCGSRGPLDDDATSVTLDAAVDSEPIVDAATEDGLSDAGRRRDAGPVACGMCVISTCGDMILSCLQSAACRSVFQCVATNCLGGGGGGGGGGGLSPLCMFECAGDDPSGALGVRSIFRCITGPCGADCGSVLGGLGGGGGGRGGAKGLPGAFREIFSPWPELSSPTSNQH